MRHLAGGHTVHLEEVYKEHAILVHGLGTVGGNAPVRRQRRFFPFQPVKAQHRIRVAHIDSQQHCFSVHLRGTNSARLHRHQAVRSTHLKEPVFVQPGCNAHTGLRAVHFNLPPSRPC